MFNRKKIKDLEEKLKDSYVQIRRLKSEIELVKLELNARNSEIQRIKWLVNDRINSGCVISTESTKKGIPTLITINKKSTQIEIKVFDLATSNANSEKTLILWASARNKGWFIDDIQGGNSLGHGELAMNHLIRLAKEDSSASITGKISTHDLEHRERLFAFYKKFDFDIEFGDEKKFGRIYKQL